LIDPINSPGQDDSDDDCIITSVGQAQKELVSAPTRKRVPGDKSVIKRPVLANSPLDLSNSVGNRATVQLSQSFVPVTQGGSLQTPPPSRQHSLRSLRTGGPTSALEAAPTNLSTETKSYPALESHLDATGNHDKPHDGVELTSVPSAGISDEYVHHDTHYNLLICKLCHLAEAPEWIGKHYNIFHHGEPGVGPDTIGLLYDKYHDIGAARNLQEANLPFPCPVIPHLTVYHTSLKCGSCRKVFPGQDLDALKKHLLSHFTSDGWYNETDYDWIVTSEFSYTQIFSNVCNRVTYIETVPPSAQTILGETVRSFVAPIFDTPMTKSQQLFLLRGLQELSARDDARWFTRPWTSTKRASVSKIRGFYHDRVTNPMNMKIMEVRLKNAGYESMWVYIDDFKQIVCNSALYNGRRSKYSSTLRKLELIFDQRITEALSAPYITDTELAAPILPEAKEYSLGIQTAEDRDYELELSNSPWRRYRTPEPEAHSLPSSDEHTPMKRTGGKKQITNSDFGPFLEIRVDSSNQALQRSEVADLP
jgi:hypothetical protein